MRLTTLFLLADFHVCLAEQMGHRVLVDVLRDLTARTTLAATLYQSKHDAGQFCRKHAAIVKALEAGDTAEARRLMLDRIGNVEQALEVDAVAAPDPSERLRAALTPTKSARRARICARARHRPPGPVWSETPVRVAFFAPWDVAESWPHDDAASLARLQLHLNGAELTSGASFDGRRCINARSRAAVNPCLWSESSGSPREAAGLC